MPSEVLSSILMLGITIIMAVVVLSYVQSVEIPQALALTQESFSQNWCHSLNNSCRILIVP